MDYDEDVELARYMFDFCWKFMSEFEFRVGYFGWLAEAKSAIGHNDYARKNARTNQ